MKLLVQSWRWFPEHVLANGKALIRVPFDLSDGPGPTALFIEAEPGLSDAEVEALIAEACAL